MLLGDLVTTREAATLLRVSPNTVSPWLWKGKLRRVKVGSRTLLAKSDLEEFLRRENPERPVDDRKAVDLLHAPPHRPSANFGGRR
jgi:excisionase family DNA binding protein